MNTKPDYSPLIWVVGCIIGVILIPIIAYQTLMSGMPTDDPRHWISVLPLALWAIGGMIYFWVTEKK